ncbi:selenide, water dikinase SelD [Cyanobium sp. FACHB-13342]|uniref:selenide, water dikinase SelD n=1 Tax=Cyanobium sp. FACHB-13342 TaxID=2692793 RepID=UPI0016818B96|nr:selenide, water dikinase SelD [Cyanobium sp. FACHB-13342]MBD2422225.1 selenide, water dikinase SelD [Cyanobium sp. FACHB-13342]
MATEGRLVLAGGGHSHALVLRMWAMARGGPGRRPPARITLVSRHSTALYSGMVPGLVAGLYDIRACSIDLRRLCRLAGVTFVQAEITGLDPQARELQLKGRPRLGWDWLSLDVGAETIDIEEGAMAIKPLEPFLQWCGQQHQGGIRIRGGGAAAVEVALALRARGLQPELRLRGSALHLGSAAANRLGERLLQAAGITLQTHSPEGAGADLACTGSRAPRWLAASGLPSDARGRLLTGASLEVLNHPGLFASGDCGVLADQPRPPSGVWAVRCAPTLAHNLSAAVMGRPLRSWRAQRWALQLLGDGGSLRQKPQAVAFWGPWAFGPSRLLWRWKHHLDQRFMDRFSGLQAMERGKVTPMACRGCAAKLAASPLQDALARNGLGGSTPGSAEDAAVIGHTLEGRHLLQSVDGFPALVDDAWLNARLTTLHACSDLWACGARVTTVQAVVTLPELGERIQADLLSDTLAGIQSVLEPLGARLIGGHTLEARDSHGPSGLPGGLSLVLNVNGCTAAGVPWAKGPLRPGDGLLLSRPIGSGVLFAAAMAGSAEPAWIDAALLEMQRSQAALVELLARHGCRACTDVTGFGLLGHLGEMLAASPAPRRVTLKAAAIPALAGALPLLEQGWASSLAPSNASALALLGKRIELDGPADAARRGLLIDPQTCGPLLAAIPADQCDAALADLQQAGFSKATLIGQVHT